MLRGAWVCLNTVSLSISGSSTGLVCSMRNFSGGRQQRGLGEVGLVRGARAKARMRAHAIVKVQIPAKPGAGLGDTDVGVQIDLFILHRAPEPLDKHIVTPGCLAIHADRDAVS